MKWHLWLTLIVLCVPAFKAQEPRLFWTMDRNDINRSAVYALTGNPDVWIYDASPAGSLSNTGIRSTFGKIVGDFDNQDVVFFLYQSQGIIDKHNVSTSTLVSRHYASLAPLKDLTLDWIGKNIYYTHENMVSIWSYKNDRYAVIMDDLDGPEGIDVDPIARLLFWSEPASSAISRSSLSGSEKQIVVEGLDHPRIVTVDPNTQTLFWINDGDNSIERSDYQGQDRRRVVEAAEHGYVAMDIYKDAAILATDFGTLMLILSNLNGTIFNTIQLTTEGQIVTEAQQHGLYIASRESQPSLPDSMNDPCMSNNGGCQHICIPDLSGVQCVCQTFFRLSSDGRQCISQPGPRLFWTLNRHDINRNAIYALDGNPDVWIQDVSQLEITQELSRIRSDAGKIVADFNNPDVVFFLQQTRGIIDEYNIETSSLISRHYASTEPLKDLTLDWIGQNIYYTHENMVSIWSYKNDHYAVIIDDLEGPEGIDVDPIARLLFWSEPSNGTISRSSLSGSEKQIIVEGLDDPHIVTVDPNTQTLFWINDGDNSIESSDYQGQNRSQVINGGSVGFVGMVVYKDVLILATDSGSDFFVHHVDGTRLNTIHLTVNEEELTEAEQHGLYMASRASQPLTTTDPCGTNNGGCDLICVSETSGPLCLCQSDSAQSEVECFSITTTARPTTSTVGSTSRDDRNEESGSTRIQPSSAEILILLVIMGVAITRAMGCPHV